MTQKAEAVLIRFLKGFGAGGVGAVLTVITSGIAIHSMTDFKHVLGVLLTAFVSGGLLAVEKSWSWQDLPTTLPTTMNT